MDDLAKIDELRMRFNISYKDAAELLKETNGDLVEALVRLEQKSHAKTEEAFNKGPEMWDKVKDNVKNNSSKTIVISKEGKTVAQIPAPIGAVGVLGALVYTPLTILAGVGTVAALANNYSFKLADKTTDAPDENQTCQNTQFHQDEYQAEVVDTEVVDTEKNNKENHL